MNETDIAMTDVTMSASTPVVSVKPVVLSAPVRGEDLRPRLGANYPFLFFRTALACRWTATDRWLTSGLLMASWSCNPPISTRGR